MDFENVDAERTWAAAVVAVVVALVGGSLLFPDTVYAGFIWQYFWGPVYADANGALCAVWDGGARTLLTSSAACQAATGPVAYPGYTIVSEVGYMVTLLFMLVGVVFLLRRLDVGEERSLFYGLLPFMFFGGALRVVEDAMDALAPNAPITYPLNTLLISPVIYFTVFALAVGALVTAVWVGRRTDREYERVLFGIGVVVLGLTLGYLLVLAATTTQVGFHPQFSLLTLGIATVVTAAVWWLLERYWPVVNLGTGLMGAVIIWGHAVDGTANVIGLDWARELGLGADLVSKHPVNAAVVDVTAAVLPASVVTVTGDAWPFLLVKLVAAVLVVWVFDETIFEESPRYSILLLIAVLAVGLGPGTRDMLRMTFQI